tara:strand:- start:133 stop:618 length:486 start_codon:yes stop_codon:yes gene_type:complete
MAVLLQTEIDLPLAETRNLPSEPDGSRQEIADFMNGLAPWQVFFTGTFAGSFSESQTQRAFEKFMMRKYSEITYFYVIEHNPSREGHHVHALMYSGEPIWRDSLNQHWFTRFGYAKVEKINSVDDVTRYCTKHVANYLTKGGGWWNYKINCSELWRRHAKS